MITKRWLPFLGKHQAEAMRKQSFLLFVASMVALLASEGSAFAQCFNTATGQGALHYNQGCYNTADGFGALQGNPNGGNTAPTLPLASMPL